MASQDGAATQHEAAGLGSSFVLDLRSRGVRTVRDAVFLHGYAEPVLLILHEVAPTWAGRLALRNDTCALDAFSVGLASNQATRIWGDTRLPYDCTQLVAVPPPTGGCLVLGAAFLLYRAQGVPPVTLALGPLSCGTPNVQPHEIGEDGRPLAPPSGASSVNPTPAVASHATLSGLFANLEGARVVFPQEGGALIATQQGTVLGLHLHAAGRTVTQLELVASGTTHGQAQVLLSHPSSLVSPAPGLLFAPSRCRDAVLTRYVYVPPRMVVLSLEAPPSKKPRTEEDGTGDAPAPQADVLMDDEDALLYGTGGGHDAAGDAPSAAAVKEEAARVAGPGGLAPLAPGGTYTLGLADTLLCHAPVVTMAVGEAPLVGDTSPDGSATRSELLLGCGAGVHGTLVATHRGVVLDLVASVPLPGVRGAWALHARKAGQAAAGVADPTDPGGARVHDYLLLSTGSGTMVLDASSSDELAEVSDKAEFETAMPTLGAGALFGGARLVQAHPGGVRLCAGLVKAQDVGLAGLAPPAAPSVKVVAADVIHPYVLLRLSDGSLRLLAGNPATNRVEPVVPKAGKRALVGRTEFVAATLYDDAAGNGALTAMLGGGPKVAAQHYVVAATAAGSLEVFSLPAQACVFASDGLAAGMHLLCASPAARAACSTIDMVKAAGEDTPEAPVIADVRLDVFPHDASHEAPLLTAVRSDGEIMSWRGFSAPAHVTPGARRVVAGATELRFARYAALDCPAPPPGRPAPGPGELDTLPRRLVSLVGIRGGAGAAGSVNGVLVLGDTPQLLIAHRGTLRAHPVRLPAGASGMAAATPFHNVNCLHGVVVATTGADGGALRIATLPPGVDLTTPWPSTLHRLGCTPVALAYAPEARCYAAVAAVRRPFRARTVEPGDMHGETAARLAAAAAELRSGLEDAHEVRLLSPGSLATQWVLPLDPGEVGLALCPLPVRNAATGEMVNAICVGTGVLAGEDAPCRGRVVLITVSWTQGAPGAPQLVVARTGRVVVDRSFKSAVTAAAPLEGQYRGYILLAVGTKLGVHVWNGGSDLTCVAFFDTPAYSVSLATVRNFVLLGDVHKGLFFLRWKDTPTDRVLALLAKTFERLDFAAGEFITDGNTLSLLGGDTLGVLHVYAFTPGTAESWMGQKLLPRSRFHTGRGVCRALCLRAPGVQTVPRTGVMLASLEGALAGVTPLDEAIFNRLRSLEGAMVLGLPHAAGLNPAASRAPRERQGRVGKQPCSGTLVDCTCLRNFLEAPWAAQHALAAAAGFSRAALVSDAKSAQANSAWFM